MTSTETTRLIAALESIADSQIKMNRNLGNIYGVLTRLEGITDQLDDLNRWADAQGK